MPASRLRWIAFAHLEADGCGAVNEFPAAVPQAYRRLAGLASARLAIMHGSSYEGDAARLLRTMADVYEQRYGCQQPEVAGLLPGHAEQAGPRRSPG